MRPIMPKDRVRHLSKLLFLHPYDEHARPDNTAGSPGDFATDVLSDLMHYCDAFQVDVGDILSAAQGLHATEVNRAAEEATLLVEIEARSEDAGKKWLEEFSGLDTDDSPLMAEAIEDYLTDENFQERHGVLTGLSADALAWVREVAIKLFCEEERDETLTQVPAPSPNTPTYTVIVREPDGDGDPLNGFYRWTGAAVSAEEAAKAAIIDRMSRNLETTGDDGETVLAVVGVFLGADLTPLR